MSARRRGSTVVLLSGGLDSAANLAFAAEEGGVALALTADYGQRAARREIASAQALSRHYDIAHETVDLRWLGALGGSALTEEGREMPRIATDALDDLSASRATARAVWVPNRNAVLIAAASAFAESNGASRVVVGFNREEAATFPDNSSAYLEAATAANRYSTANGVEVASYTDSLDKRGIVGRLRELSRPFPFELLWSCYEGGERPCGICESCTRLARALV